MATETVIELDGDESVSLSEQRGEWWLSAYWRGRGLGVRIKPDERRIEIAIALLAGTGKVVVDAGEIAEKVEYLCAMAGPDEVTMGVRRDIRRALGLEAGS